MPEQGPSNEVMTRNFTNLMYEVRAQSFAKNVHPFSGESRFKFKIWKREMDRISTIFDDERMKIIACSTLNGTAADFSLRLFIAQPNLTWPELFAKLKAQYNDLSDQRYAREKLRKLYQMKEELVQNFAERLRLVAEEAYENVSQPFVQQILLETFSRGVKSDDLCKQLIKENYQNFDQAVKFAIQEQQNSRIFRLYRGNKTVNPELSGVNVTKSRMTYEKLHKLKDTTQNHTTPYRRHINHEWTNDGRPICRKCKGIGHKQCFCTYNGQNGDRIYYHQAFKKPDRPHIMRIRVFHRTNTHIYFDPHGCPCSFSLKTYILQIWNRSEHV